MVKQNFWYIMFLRDHIRYNRNEITQERDMGSGNFKMPTFGVGPIYVICCLIFTIIGILFRDAAFLRAGRVAHGRFFFIAFGILFLLGGIYLWVHAVLLQKINASVRKQELLTTGVYGFVRNPVYSAFLFIFTGALLFAANYRLLLLPILYWAMLTVLMKQTEEKWLLRQFGEEYALYCKKVNRVIPWFPKRKSSE